MSAWTTQALLRWTTQHFQKKGIDSPRVSAEMLLSHVLGVDRLKLYMDPNRPASELERAAFRELVERASAHEPVDYLVGQAPFFSMMLTVNRHVLIPRPSTETLVEHIIQHARRTPGFSGPAIADLCTGSGAIAIALAKHIEGAHVLATDISPEALDVARSNAEDQDVADRITFVQGDGLDPVKATGRMYRYLVANPPYIPDAEWLEVAPNVKDHEPALALRGGADGLDVLRPIIAEAHAVLDAPGHMALEIAASQEDVVLQLAGEAAGLSNPQVLADHEALPRVLVADHG